MGYRCLPTGLGVPQVSVHSPAGGRFVVRALVIMGKATVNTQRFGGTLGFHLVGELRHSGSRDCLVIG